MRCRRCLPDSTITFLPDVRPGEHPLLPPLFSSFTPDCWSFLRLKCPSTSDEIVLIRYHLAPTQVIVLPVGALPDSQRKLVQPTYHKVGSVCIVEYMVASIDEIDQRDL